MRENYNHRVVVSLVWVLLGTSFILLGSILWWALRGLPLDVTLQLIYKFSPFPLEIGNMLVQWIYDSTKFVAVFFAGFLFLTMGISIRLRSRFGVHVSELVAWAILIGIIGLVFYTQVQFQYLWLDGFSTVSSIYEDLDYLYEAKRQMLFLNSIAIITFASPLIFLITCHHLIRKDLFINKTAKDLP